MGILFGRDYEHIIDDLSRALVRINGCYEMLHMTDEEWGRLDEADRLGCVRTLADDLFYGLGTERSIYVAGSRIQYDSKRHLIRVELDEAVTWIIYLL